MMANAAAKSEIMGKFGELVRLHARVSAIEREGRLDSEPRGGKPNNWANHWPEDDYERYEIYKEGCEAYKRRCTERSKKRREIEGEAYEIRMQLWEKAAREALR
jgi:hypothetical protein